MSCPRGGSHKWRQMRAKSGASGITTLQQCRKCGATRDTLHPIIKFLIFLAVLAAIVSGIRYFS